MKSLPYILFEKYINILALKMSSPRSQHCASCVGTLSFPVMAQLGLNLRIIVKNVFRLFVALSFSRIGH